MRFVKEVNCDICDSNDRHIIGEPKSTNEIPDILKSVTINIVRCRRCGFYYIDPMVYFDKGDYVSLYDSQYFNNTNMSNWWMGKRRRDRVERLNKLERYKEGKISKFLDIGCGEGYVLEEASRRGWDAYGVDIVNNLIQRIRQRGNIKFSEGDLRDIKYPDNYFDAIYLDSVLEHVQSPTELMREINRILTCRGVLYIGVPNENALDKKIRNLIRRIKNRVICANLNPLQKPYHIVGFTPRVLYKMADKTRFIVRDMKTFGGVYEFRKRRFKLEKKAVVIHLILLPVYFAGLILNRGTYIEAYLTKR